LEDLDFVDEGEVVVALVRRTPSGVPNVWCHLLFREIFDVEIDLESAPKKQTRKERSTQEANKGRKEGINEKESG
jgi:hypothetical protein